MVDWTRSSVVGDLGCLDNAILFPQIWAQGQKIASLSATLNLVLQNLSSVTDGSIWITVAPDDGNCTVNPLGSMVPVAAGLTAIYSVALQSNVGAGYVITITLEGAQPVTFNMNFSGSGCV